MERDIEKTGQEYDITKNPHFNKLLEILACPKCKGQLEYQEEQRRWICKPCSRLYFIENGVPNFLIDESVIIVKSPKTDKEIEFSKESLEYKNGDGESFILNDIESLLKLKLKCLEESCEGNLVFNAKKVSYLCSQCGTEYAIPNGITNCLKESKYT